MSENPQLPENVTTVVAEEKVVPAGRTPHRKVVAAGIGAGFGVATANLLNGGLGDLFYGGHGAPGYVTAWISIAVPGGLALAAGYFTRRAANE